MNSEEYITQHFPPRPSQKGAKENTDAFNARIYWFKNNFPTYNEVADHFNYKFNRIKNYANKYNWKLIRENYEELQEQESLKEAKKKQKKLEKNIDKSNEITFGYYNKRRRHLLWLLGELDESAPPKKLDYDEEIFLRAELDKIHEKLFKLQPLMRTNSHLPNSYNDAQIINSDNKHSHTIDKEGLDYFKDKEEYKKDFVTDDLFGDDE